VPVANDLAVDPPRTTSDSEPEERRMIGDFNGNANDLWTLFGDEVKSHDDVQIKIVKDTMDSALIFVRSNSVCAYCGFGLANIWPYRLVYIPLSLQGS
jgi:hypothetical protein